MFWLKMVAAAFIIGFCANLGSDAYFALSGLLGLCRG